MTAQPYTEKAVVIGVSAGALEALSIVLPNLPADYPFPVFCVVHLPPDRKSIMAELLSTKCKMKVKEAEDKEPIKAGTIYIAPPDYHLLVENNGLLSLSNEAPVLYSRPSIDVLFETAADAYGENLTGIILTGANSDGALGMRAIANAGGTTVVQDPALAHASTMPQAALKACPDSLIFSLEDIAYYLQKAPAQ